MKIGIRCCVSGQTQSLCPVASERRPSFKIARFNGFEKDLGFEIDYVEILRSTEANI